jgi:hypothetical protein
MVYLQPLQATWLIFNQLICAFLKKKGPGNFLQSNRFIYFYKIMQSVAHAYQI